jgi:thiamine-monophosphate kinase
VPLGEFELIDRWFKRHPGRDDVLLGVGDDAALLQVPSGMALVATTDTLVEGVHFLPDAPADSIGHQALAVNLSDLAAMGALPAWVLLSLSLPAVDEAWLAAFAAGFHTLALRSGVALVGGDTVRGPYVVTVTALGYVERGQALERRGARPGDNVYVSGYLGEAAAGLELLRNSAEGLPDDVCVRRHRYAEPRIELGRALRLHATAAMDVSDGLLGDLAKLCAASGVGARVELERLPLSAALLARCSHDAAEQHALNGGDDYELLFTLPPDLEPWSFLPATSVRVTRIGSIAAGAGVACSRDGIPLDCAVRGHDHFAR